jgi:hypothetical protein
VYTGIGVVVIIVIGTVGEKNGNENSRKLGPCNFEGAIQVN